MSLWPEIPCASNSPMRGVLELLNQLASSRSPIMLIGESGTGKEVIARAIHKYSPRAAQNIVAINCGAIPETLIESELFGYVKGAFTGAHQDRPGKVRQAHQGTLFLDEIGELSPLAQTRLLRVLQERRVCPVGSSEEIAVDFRLICASHRNLEAMVQAGTFREDLYYRLMVFPVHLPSLNQRSMDIPSLSQQIWTELAHENLCELPPLQPSELQHLQIQKWPGNIRQLRHALERYQVYQRLGWSLERACEPLASTQESPRLTQSKPQGRWHTAEQERILKILEQTRFNKSKAALALNMSRGSFLRYLKKIGLDC